MIEKGPLSCRGSTGWYIDGILAHGILYMQNSVKMTVGPCVFVQLMPVFSAWWQFWNKVYVVSIILSSTVFVAVLVHFSSAE